MTPDQYIENIATAPFDELAFMIDQLLFIDNSSLDIESTKSSKIFTTLYRLLAAQGRRYKAVLKMHDEVMVERRRYYGGKATAEQYKKEPLNVTLLKTEIEGYMDIDAKVCAARGFLADTDMRIKFIEDSIKVAKNRGFDIKNALTWMQLTSSK